MFQKMIARILRKDIKEKYEENILLRHDEIERNLPKNAENLIITDISTILVKNKISKSLIILSFPGGWGDRFVEPEEEIYRYFKEYTNDLTKKYGEPIYSGKGPRNGVKNIGIELKTCFRSALQIVCWKFEESIIILMHTGHDANSLQFVRLAQEHAK